MIAATQMHLRGRAQEFVESLSHVPSLSLTITNGTSKVGGGAAPETDLPTTLIVVKIEGKTAEHTLIGLRKSEPSVIARIVENRVVLDLRTILPEQQDTLITVVEKLSSSS